MSEFYAFRQGEWVPLPNPPIAYPEGCDCEAVIESRGYARVFGGPQSAVAVYERRPGANTPGGDYPWLVVVSPFGSLAVDVYVEDLPSLLGLLRELGILGAVRLAMASQSPPAKARGWPWEDGGEG